MEFPEAEPGARGGDDVPPLGERQHEVIQIRRVDRPLLRLFESDRDCGVVDAGLQEETVFGGLPDRRAAFTLHGGDDFAEEIDLDAVLRRVHDPAVDGDARLREVRRDRQAVDAELRLDAERHILPDAALDVVDRPLRSIDVRDLLPDAEGRAVVGEDTDRENVLPGFRRSGHIELERREIAVVIPDLDAVQEHLRIVADHVEIQHDPAVFQLLRREIETGAVVAADVRLFGGLLLRIFLVPVERYGDVVPLRVVECGSGILPVKPVVGRNRPGGGFKPGTFPDSVQGTGLDEISDRQFFCRVRRSDGDFRRRHGLHPLELVRRRHIRGEFRCRDTQRGEGDSEQQLRFQHATS